MKFFLIIIFFSCVGFSQASTQKFILITKDNGKKLLGAREFSDDIKKLDEPLRALAAWYSAAGGTLCDSPNDSEFCGLTTALGLGKQGSEAHKALLKKYFYDDAAAQQFIKQDCFVRSDVSGGTPLTTFEYLNFSRKGNFVTVNYAYHYLESADSETITKGPDKYEIKGDHIIVLKRKIWKSYLKKKKKIVEEFKNGNCNKNYPNQRSSCLY